MVPSALAPAFILYVAAVRVSWKSSRLLMRYITGRPLHRFASNAVKMRNG